MITRYHQNFQRQRIAAASKCRISADGLVFAAHISRSSGTSAAHCGALSCFHRVSIP